ncbi:hypothetical protein DYB32_010096, partial [Aphanomyces invadans]
VGTLHHTLASIEWVSGGTAAELLADRVALAESSYDVVPDVEPPPTRPDNYRRCIWNRFNYKVDKATNEGEENREQCFDNVFEYGKVLAYPFPRSSYHYDTDPKHVMDSDAKPHITVDAAYDLTGNGFTNFDPKIYDFETFERDGASILYKSIKHSVGLYWMTLVAYDFNGVESSECSACLSVTDMYRPRGGPGGKTCTNTNVVGYADTTLKNLLPPVQQLIAYRQKATNNKCSNVRCDDVGLTRTDFFSLESARESFSGKEVEDPLDGWTTCMGAPLTNNEWAKLTTSVFTASSDIPDVHTCARSCKYDLALKEIYTAFNCDVDYTIFPPKPICDGESTEACAFVQQVTARSTDLVSSFSVKLKAAPAKVPIQDPAAVFPGSNYPPPTDTVKKELHFDVSCDSTAPDFATFCTSQLQVKVSDLFELDATLNPNPAVAALLNGRTTSAAPIVFWRVKNTAAGAWHVIENGDLKDPSVVLTFPRFKTELIFEAFTACGKLGDITWNVYVHRHEVVRIDDWWYSMWDCGAGKCNVEHTDFRVCKFKFDPKCDTYLSMLNPSDAKPTIPIDPVTKGSYKVCEYKDAKNEKQMCSNGCWWHYASCDTSSSEESCADRIRQEGNRFVYCGEGGEHEPPLGEVDSHNLAAQVLLEAFDDEDKVTNTKYVKPFAKQCKCTTPACKGRVCKGCSTSHVSPTAPTEYECQADDGTKDTCLANIANNKPEKDQFYWCGDGTNPDVVPSPVPAPEVRIKWQFLGLQCTWKYRNSKSAAQFLNTINRGADQIAFEKEVAIKMQNIDVTEVTVTCEFNFKSYAAKSDALPLKKTRSKTILIQNCDHPRWNAEHPIDQGRFIKDVCNVVSWYSDVKKRQPAPFQACRGALVYPDGPSTEANAAKTIYVETTSDLQCCNIKGSDRGDSRVDSRKSPDGTFTCQKLPGDFSTGLCTDSKSSKYYYTASFVGAASMVDSAQAYVRELLVAGGFLAAVAVVAAVSSKQRASTAAVEMDDAYMQLLA